MSEPPKRAMNSEDSDRSAPRCNARDSSENIGKLRSERSSILQDQKENLNLPSVDLTDQNDVKNRLPASENNILNLKKNNNMKFFKIVECPVIVSFACVVPLVARLYDRGYVGGYAVKESVVALFFASILSWYVLHQLKQHAASQYLAYVLPLNLIIYGVALTFMALTRTPYSGFLFTIGTCSGLVASFGLAVYGRSVIKPHIILAVGRASEIAINGQYKYAPSLADLNNLIDSGWRDWALVTDLHYPHSADWERLFAKASLASIPVYHYKQIAEAQSGQVKIAHLSENELGSLIPNISYTSIKRVVDISIALVLIPALMPLFVLISAIIVVDSPGRPFYIQRRIGFRGNSFRMIKFRTMHNRSSVEEEMAKRDDAMTKSDDKRITRVGRYLRKTRIDELPQVINVLAGQMSFIGPRPEAESLSEWYEAELPFYSYRHIVRPGITGWAQVNQGHVTDVSDIVDKLRFDFYYIKNISLWLDVLVVIKTFRVIITGAGAR
jgi:lipopolysaccharide/colanic/teichoic acid biosynthesis glycosyltransferase